MGHQRIAVRAVHNLHLIVQHRSLAADERKGAVEIRRRIVAVRVGPHPPAPLQRVHAERVGGDVAQFIEPVFVPGGAGWRTAGTEGIRNADRGRVHRNRVRVVLAAVLHPRFGDGLAAQHRGFRDEEVMLAARRICATIRQREGANPGIILRRALPLVSQGQRVLVVERDVELGGELLAHGRRRHRGLRAHRQKVLVQGDRIDHAKFVDVAPLEVEREGDLLRQRASEIAAELLRLETRLGFRAEKRIARIERVVIEAGGYLPAQFVHAGLGKDLDASVADVIVLGRKRIRIDANFANRRLGGQRSAAEPVDVDLATIGPGRGARQRLQVVLQLVGIVGKRIQVGALQRQSTRVLVRAHFDVAAIVVDRYLLRRARYAELDIDAAVAAHGEGLHLIHGEALLIDHDVVGAGRQSNDGEAADAVAGHGLHRPAGRLQHYGCARHDGSPMDRAPGPSNWPWKIAPYRPRRKAI